MLHFDKCAYAVQVFAISLEKMYAANQSHTLSLLETVTLTCETVVPSLMQDVTSVLLLSCYSNQAQ